MAAAAVLRRRARIVVPAMQQTATSLLGFSEALWAHIHSESNFDCSMTKLPQDHVSFTGTPLETVPAIAIAPPEVIRGITAGGWC